MSFNHFDDRGQAIMVDITEKKKTLRTAIASARVLMKRETLQAILDGDTKKGDVLGVARLAGIAASKKTPDLIPCLTPWPFIMPQSNLTAILIPELLWSARLCAPMRGRGLRWKPWCPHLWLH